MKKLLVVSFLVLYSFLGTECMAQYTILHNFNNTQGEYPNGSLTPSGNTLYGMTMSGGTQGPGVIFSIQTNGSGYTDIYDFKIGTTGGDPWGSLILSGSTLFGMTLQGGANGYGVIFAIQTNGSNYTILHNFTDSLNDGSGPEGSLVISGDTLYGMTYYGGAKGFGIIFSIKTNGTSFKDLYDFDQANGSSPTGDLTLKGSTLYGMTSAGGTYSGGVIFMIQTNGSGFNILHNFGGPPSDGWLPNGSLILSGSTLYGMTEEGGTLTNGIIFSIQTNGSNYTNCSILTQHPNIFLVGL